MVFTAFSEIANKPVGVFILVATVIVILAIRGKMKKSERLGRGILFVGDMYNSVRFFGFLFICLIIFFLLKSISDKNSTQSRKSPSN
jgi:hypothetical protein